ncbi:hypothetical protein A8144_02995 [Mycobacterium leprae 3125609]|nr:hypothetical protein A8144_02995 [Mycobacterium leprae 3125609]OAX71159.1 hypothetical protein A3216_07380 [Mycobacterium leprae 7935681]
MGRVAASPAECFRLCCCSATLATSGRSMRSKYRAVISFFIHGCAISRNRSGSFTVNLDWPQVLAGAGYALADRRVVAHAVPDLYERVGLPPASPFAQTLLPALIDATPEAFEDPVVVVPTPGIRFEIEFYQVYLVFVLGFPLVGSADLVVRDGKLWMRSLSTLKPGRHGVAPGQCRLRRSAGFAVRFQAERGGFGRSVVTRGA